MAKDLRKLIQDQVKSGSDRLETFQNVLNAAEFDPYITPSKDFDELLNADDLDEQQKEVRDLIQTEFEGRKCRAKVCKMRILNSQYAVDAQEKDGKFQSLTLFDLISGENKPLTVEGTIPAGFVDYKLAAMNSTHFLLIANGNLNVFTVYLLELDAEELKATLLDKQIVIGRFLDFVVDSDSWHKFVLQVRLNDKREYLCVGHVKHSKLDINAPLLLDTEFGVEFDGVKLENQKIYKVAFDTADGKVSKMVVKELTLSLARTRSEVLCELDNETKLSGEEIQQSKFVWSGRVCYGLCQNKSADATLFKINLKTKKATKIEKKKNVAAIFDMFVDKDETLIICTKNEDADLHVIQNYLLK